MVRRIVAGLLLIGLGAALFGSQMPLVTGRLPLAVALLLVWAVPGVLVLLGRPIGRLAGLAVAAVGAALAVVAAIQANSGEAQRFAEIFFQSDGPAFSWPEVFFGAFAFGVLAGACALLLARPFRGPEPGDAATG